MIALDTNVLVRFLVEDDLEQAARANAFLLNALETQNLCFVSDIVLCELVWVLERSYDFRPREICALLRKLLLARQLAFSAVDQIERALASYEQGRGGFADYLIREHARGAGCTQVVTFERDLVREDGFIAP